MYRQAWSKAVIDYCGWCHWPLCQLDRYCFTWEENERCFRESRKDCHCYLMNVWNCWLSDGLMVSALCFCHLHQSDDITVWSSVTPALALLLLTELPFMKKTVTYGRLSVPFLKNCAPIFAFCAPLYNLVFVRSVVSSSTHRCAISCGRPLSSEVDNPHTSLWTVFTIFYVVKWSLWIINSNQDFVYARWGRNLSCGFHKTLQHTSKTICQG